MSYMKNREILSSRIINSPVEMVYQAFENPNHLKNWWGPEGFTNTIHEFDLRVGGNWILTMHGPEKGNYENSSVFKTVLPNKLISWERKSQPLFDMEIAFEKLEENKTQISFKMIFATAEECEKMRKFVEPKNEENFNRLEREIKTM
ncbi:MAG: SRPBCC family protein [Saprospiraceae bacterium]|nr:SRPBCC family protein [Saprospiraceae bacterium]